MAAEIAGRRMLVVVEFIGEDGKDVAGDGLGGIKAGGRGGEGHEFIIMACRFREKKGILLSFV